MHCTCMYDFIVSYVANLYEGEDQAIKDRKGVNGRTSLYINQIHACIIPNCIFTFAFA